MDAFIERLLQLRERHPEGFTIVLPDGIILEVEWVLGHKVEQTERGTTIKRAIGIIVRSDFGEALVTLAVEE